MGADPQGLDRQPRRDLYWFIHNVYANFFKDSLQSDNSIDQVIIRAGR